MCPRNLSARSAIPARTSSPSGRQVAILFWSALCLFYNAVPVKAVDRADSVVVFNEIQYHPVEGGETLEWVELYNQLAVNVDLSRWSLKGGAQFTFPENTVIPGRGYLVIAATPAELRAATGSTNVLGPYTGRLSNGGEKIELRNNDGRVMDAVQYGVEYPWPVAPDGSGVSLAKRDEDQASRLPENWAPSALRGGTPGRRNFPLKSFEVTNATAVPVTNVWRFNASGDDLGAGWRAPGYDDSSWPAGAALFRAGQGSLPPGNVEAIPSLFSSGRDAEGSALANGSPDPHYWLTRSAQTQPPPPAIRATVIQNHPAWLANGGGSSWLGAVDPGTTDVAAGEYHFATDFDLSDFDPATTVVKLKVGADNALLDVVLNGVSRGIAFSGFSSWSPEFTLNSGFVRGANRLEFLTLNEGDGANPAGFRAQLSGTGRRQMAVNTPLATAPVTTYFRSQFVVSGPAQHTALMLRTAVSDGAVFYLNGTAVLRLNLPGGAINNTTLALTNASSSTLAGPFVLPSAALLSGTNVLAVEVHSAAAPTNDLLFAAELSLQSTNVLVPPPVALAFNEIASATNADFWVELMNYGEEPVNLEGMAISRRGSLLPRDYVFTNQWLAPGAFLQVPRATLGFSADPGDRLFLYRPFMEGVLDAVVAKRDPKARFPDGQGLWLYPAEPTPGQANRFALRSDVVINEIFYHPPPLPARVEEQQTVSILQYTNAWRYHALGQDLGSAWRQPLYPDTTWPSGPGVFYFTSSTLPATKGTPLPLLANNVPIRTYYFRTTFTAQTNRAELLLKPLLDDGAVYYLNGVEVLRQNMASGAVTHNTLANAGVATADFSGPFKVAVTNLVLGTNVLAVEVHQFTTNQIAADVVFGLEVAVNGALTPGIAAADPPGSWVEILNRGSNVVNLAGWRLAGDVEADFEPGASLAPGEYLVLPQDAAYMASNYPGIHLGPTLSRKLPRGGGLLSLRDLFGNPVNEVRYYDGGTWPEYADGGGASLELRDPRSDNSRPESWAASLPPAIGWNHYSYRAVARNVVGPILWNEFVLGLLEAGECLIDDLSVIESPGSNPVQLLQNGSFDTGFAAWRALGTHGASRVVDDPDQPGNKVLRLVSTGPSGHLHNHLETTLAGGRSVVNGREYEVSFRAKWLAGNPRLNTRLYFDRVARTTLLNRPSLFGTPGAPNSVYAANVGPSFSGLRHDPAVPQPNEAVTISVKLADPDGVGAVALRWREDGGSWQSAPMTSTETPEFNGYRAFSATLPGQAAGRLIQFYVQASDGLGATAVYPAGGANSRALFRVDDLSSGALHTFRLWMTSADAAYLHDPVNVMSDDHMKLTVVYDDREIFYDAGIHLQSSQRGRNGSERVGFHIRFPADHLFRGVQNTLVMDRSGGTSGTGGRHDEILLWHAVNHAGGILGIECDLAQVFAPRAQENSTVLLRMSAFDSDYFDNLLPDGGDGEHYTLELIYYPLTSVNNDPQLPKLPQPDEVLNNEIQDWGSDPEIYRWFWIQENRAEQDDYSRLMAMNQAFSLPTASLPGRIQEHVQVDQWMRALAFKAYTGDPDTFSYGLNHNWHIYFPPGSGPALGLLWDMDYSFVFGTDTPFPGSGSANTYRIITLPDSLRRYYHHLQDLAFTTMNSGHIGPWADHYGQLMGQDWSRLTQYLQDRANFILSRMPADVAFAITVNGGKGFATNSEFALISGKAPLSTQDILVNGFSVPLTWQSMSDWQLTVPLPAYSNALTLVARDGVGRPLTNGTGFLVVTNLGLVPLKPVVVNEWMADNSGPGGFADALDQAYSDWFELYNPNASPVDLSGYYLTDSLADPTRWRIPAGTMIGPGGFLLVWADDQTGQNGQGDRGDLHAGFQLSRSGEALGLFNPAGVLQHSVLFGPQLQNVSQGLFPDGNSAAYEFMENWTPGAPNRVGAPPSPEVRSLNVSPDGQVTMMCGVLPGRTYRVEFKNSLGDPAWQTLQSDFTASGPQLLIRDEAGGLVERYYRLQLLK